MNNLMKMTMLRSGSERTSNNYDTENRSGNRGGNRYEYNSEGGSRSEYGAEARFRDRRGREHYDNGRYAPIRNEGEYAPVYGGYTQNYSGGYEMRSEGENSPNMRSWEIIESPQYNGERNEDGMTRVLGFGGNMRYELPSYEDEMSHRSGDKEHGYSNSKATPPMTREMAEEWMENIKNEDGTKGAHWTLEEVKRLMSQKGIQGDVIRMWVAMNAEYSDMVAIAKKYGVNKPDYFFDAALARWINDKDAVPDKEAAYYAHVVKH